MFTGLRKSDIDCEFFIVGKFEDLKLVEQIKVVGYNYESYDI